MGFTLADLLAKPRPVGVRGEITVHHGHQGVDLFDQHNIHRERVGFKHDALAGGNSMTAELATIGE